MLRNMFIAILLIALVIIGAVAFYENQQAQLSRQEALKVMKEKDTVAMRLSETKQVMDQQKKMEEMAKTMTVSLAEENKSGESGTATLKEQNGKVIATVSLTGFPKDTPQPDHIHAGNCPGVGKIVYPLNDVINGQSTT